MNIRLIYKIIWSTIIFLGLSATVFSDTMSASQSVVFEGFKGATFINTPPSKDAINCDNKASEITYGFPAALPAQDPDADKYTMSFHYSPSTENYEVECGVGLTTVATWVGDGNVTKQCQFTTIIGGGANYDGYFGGTGESHICKVSGDCYTDSCDDNQDHDYGGKVWIVHPKN